MISVIVQNFSIYIPIIDIQVCRFRAPATSLGRRNPERPHRNTHGLASTPSRNDTVIHESHALHIRDILQTKHTTTFVNRINEDNQYLDEGTWLYVVS